MFNKIFGFLFRPRKTTLYRVTLTFVYPQDGKGPGIAEANYPPVVAGSVLEAIVKTLKFEKSSNGYYLPGYTEVHAKVEELSD